MRELVGRKPVFGICLGHQLLCRAVGLETFKLPFGHRGANHPVKDLTTGRIAITAQNHGFAVIGPDGEHTIAGDEPVRWETDFGAAELTHLNLYDRTVEGLVLRDVTGATVQYHPEAGPGPHDCLYLFDRFLEAIQLPRRDDIERILLLGSGPIVIGQAAEFDYSGTQACKVLKDEGYEVILVNSNPATIMTDPEFADATYIEPLLPGPVAQVIEKERPDALLPTLGGGTALNLARMLHEDGTLERHGVELIGADYDAIARAEDRDLFRETMIGAGLRVPRSAIATTVEEAEAARDGIGLPIIVRPAFTLGGWGGGVARTPEEFREAAARGITASPIGQVLLDESVLGWGEFELEVMRDGNDNVVIVCSIENLDPMGVHTGDSVCVAPQQTLTDRQYQVLRDQAIAAIRAVGVETGGSNVQFAVNPATDEVVVIEMNPRVSRSSALASKATGFPIAKIAARLAVGYALEEIDNDITRRTPASFEPTIDYAVVKWPRFAFEKFPGIDAGLTTHMKSVGEVMAIGRTFQQAFAKAMRSRELDAPPRLDGSLDELLERLETPGAERFDLLMESLRRGADRRGARAPHGDRPVVPAPAGGAGRRPGRPVPRRAHVQGGRHMRRRVRGRDALLLLGVGARRRRRRRGTSRAIAPSVVILGAGPNRIGQGIEFDYCCVHAAMEVRASGRDAVMVNCNPETVSTDYDTSDRLYFEPLTLEDVLGVIEVERPEGVIVHVRRPDPAEARRRPPRRRRPAARHERRGDRPGRGRADASVALLDRLGLQAPPYATAQLGAGRAGARGRGRFPAAGAPVLRARRPGDGDRLRPRRPGRLPLAPRHGERRRARRSSSTASSRTRSRSTSTRCATASEAWIGGVMQHVEEAGIHSGDSACVLPPHSLGRRDARRRSARRRARSRSAWAWSACSTSSSPCTATSST